MSTTNHRRVQTARLHHRGELLNFEQVTERYPALTIRFLRRLRAERRVAFVKAGGRLLVYSGDLDDYFESCRTGGTAA